MSTSIFIPKGVVTHGKNISGEKVISKDFLAYFGLAASEIKDYANEQINSIIGSILGNDGSYLEDFGSLDRVEKALFSTLSDFDIIFEQGEDNKLHHRVVQRIS